MKKLIDTFFEIKEKEKKQNKAFEEYIKVVAPGSHIPILENSEIGAFLKGIKHFNKELYDLLSRWIWDCDMDGKIILDSGKEYIINSEESLITYINENLGKQ